MAKGHEKLDMKGKRRGCYCYRAVSVEVFPVKTAEIVAGSEMLKSC